MKQVILLTLMISSSAFAGGGSSTGPSLCSYGEYTCVDKAPIASIVACPFEASTIVELSNEISSTTHVFNSSQVSSRQGELGTGVEFSGEGFDLKIQTDTAPSPEGWIGVMTVPSLGLNQVELRCQKSHRFEH